LQVAHISTALITRDKEKMKTKLLTALIAIAISNPASAVISIGAPDCGEWLKDTGARGEMNKSWLLGFVSGLNLDGRNENQNPLRKISSAKQIYVWMDNYCRKNPLKTLHDGGQDLIIELDNK
jgi:hypothetical protein